MRRFRTMAANRRVGLSQGGFEFVGPPQAEAGRVVYGEGLLGGAGRAAGTPRNPGDLPAGVTGRPTLGFGGERPGSGPNAGVSRGISPGLSDSRYPPRLAVNGGVLLAIGVPIFR